MCISSICLGLQEMLDKIDQNEAAVNQQRTWGSCVFAVHVLACKKCFDKIEEKSCDNPCVGHRKYRELVELEQPYMSSRLGLEGPTCQPAQLCKVESRT